MKTAVIGSRSFNDVDLLEKTLDQYRITELISGGAKGADKLAENYAVAKGIPTRIFLPDYQKYGGKVAPLLRNEQIITAAEQVIAFWDGKSTGTVNAMNYAKKQGKKLFIIHFHPPQAKSGMKSNQARMNFVPEDKQ